VSVAIAFTAIGVLFQGVYLLTSIGLNITRRTQYYPVATVTAALVNVGLNVLLIPRRGIIGAAWANGAAYAVQAALGFMLSQRFYPMRYEWGRIARALGAAAVSYIVAMLLPSIHLVSNPSSVMATMPDVVARGLAVVVAFTGLLALTGFFRAGELRQLSAIRLGREPGAVALKAPDSTEMAGEIVATDLEPPE
jgi:O-antigen/teichoic acid export membrane protein